ncbi:MAG TPA: ABC transporter substrate-binding protein [Candidatus Atribacteria bacterium]|nr:ABC transporter substrate-binding protein [Candidatus Atribacteria bacterium]
MKKCLVVLVVLILLLGFASISFAQEEVVPGWSYNISDYQELTGKKVTELSEAPALLELVKQGEIPPVEERLPEEPLIVEPFEEIGQYGGTLHRAHNSPGDIGAWHRMVGEPLIRWDAEYKKILPNLATHWEVSEDGKTFMFYLRKDIKWSDGVPFTADDILFWYEDILLNKDLTPVPPSWFSIKGQPGKVEKLDDYTVKISFPSSFGYFLSLFAAYGHYSYAPKHYLIQFHPKYTPEDELERLAKGEGFDFWYQLFSYKNDFVSPERPTLSAWKVTTDNTATRWIAERNPYYWKVDPEGNQLPYVDRIVSDLVQSTDMIIMKAIAGELDFQTRWLETQYSSYPLLMENRTKGDYRILKWMSRQGSVAAINVNQNCKDPEIGPILQDRRFRIALSLSINRDELNELVFYGLGVPSQPALNSCSPLYDESVATKYTEYDPEKANELLDQMGFTERSTDGYRILPGGQVLAITVMVRNEDPEIIDAAELIKGYWDKLGIKVAIQTMERSLFDVRQTAGEYQILMLFHGAGIDPLLEATWLFCTDRGNKFAPLCGLWYSSGGKSGEEPPPEIAKLHAIYEEAISIVSDSRRKELVKEAVCLHSENLWTIGTVHIPWVICLAKNDLRNVPEVATSDHPISPGCARFEQFYFRR